MPAAVPVTAEGGVHVLHAARPSDVQAVLEALPPDAVQGLAGVRLVLGLQEQEAPCAASSCGVTRDPLVGRLGLPLRRGLWAPHYLGAYRNGIIELYAYVVEPTVRLDDVRRCDLLQKTLSTLTHEVAHHLEWMRRDVRGRWSEPDALRAEAFAEALQAEWTQAHVLPHVERCRRGGFG